MDVRMPKLDGIEATRRVREATDARALVLATFGLDEYVYTEIAAKLFLSDTTVKAHVAHMLQKLGLRDRIQAVVLAYESGVVQPGGG